jgi:hypothetical protein
MLKLDNFVIISLGIGCAYFILTLVLLMSLFDGSTTPQRALLYFVIENAVALGTLLVLIIKTFLYKWSVLAEIEKIKAENKELKKYIVNVKAQKDTKLNS